MPTVLHIQASPRRERSHSTRVAEEFLEAYTKAHSGYQVETLDLWSAPMIEFNGAALDAKYAVLHGKEPPDDKALSVWETIKKAAEPLFRSDKLVISVPMWNFGIPYKLKHFIDVVTQPTITFRFSPGEGYVGLVPDKPALIITARGGAYPASSPMESLDYQRPYLRQWLQFIGIRNVHEIVVEPTLGAPETTKQTEEQAHKSVLALVDNF